MVFYVRSVPRETGRSNYNETRLPSNLRPTTCECVHLFTRGLFWSRDKDGGYTIGSAVVENPVLHANGSVFYRTGVMATRSVTLRE